MSGQLARDVQQETKIRDLLTNETTAWDLQQAREKGKKDEGKGKEILVITNG